MTLLPLILVLVAELTLAPPTDESWRDNPHFVAGSRAFDAQRWTDAADEFAIAWEEESEPDLLWAWAQALRLGRRCAAAVEVYRRFLATSPTPAQIEDTRANIRLCGEDPDALPTTEPPPPPTPDRDGLPADMGPTEPTPPIPPPAARDAWGHALVWPGLAIAAVGAGLLGTAHRRVDDATNAPDDVTFRDRTDNAPALANAGIGLLSVGSAVLTAGIVRFIVVGVRHRRAKR